MFKVDLQDAKGKIPLTFFGPSNQSEVQEFCDSLKVGQVVRVKAAVNIYNGNLGLLVNDKAAFSSLGEGEYSVEDYTRVSLRNIGQMRGELHKYITSISDSDIKRVLEQLFVKDGEF